MKPRLIVRVESSGLRVEVWVNGIPVGMVLPEDSSPMAIPVNQFLSNGQNKLGAMLHAGPVPSKAGLPWPEDPKAAAYTGPAKLSLQIAKYAPDQTALRDHPPALVTIEWQGAASTRPSLQERQFSISEPLGPWAWQTATQFSEIGDALRLDVLNYLVRLHVLLESKKFEEFLDESTTKLNEMTDQAYGVSAAPMRREMLGALQSRSAPPYALDPLNPQDIDLRLVAGGRMIECLRPNRRYVLEYRNPGNEDAFFLPTMVGQVNARWRILR